MILDVFRRLMAADFTIPPHAEIQWFAIAMRPPESGEYRPCSDRVRALFEQRYRADRVILTRS
jgi:hypothetical protein